MTEIYLLVMAWNQHYRRTVSLASWTINTKTKTIDFCSNMYNYFLLLCEIKSINFSFLGRPKRKSAKNFSLIVCWLLLNISREIFTGNKRKSKWSSNLIYLSVESDTCDTYPKRVFLTEVDWTHITARCRKETPKKKKSFRWNSYLI